VEGIQMNQPEQRDYVEQKIATTMSRCLPLDAKSGWSDQSRSIDQLKVGSDANKPTPIEVVEESHVSKHNVGGHIRNSHRRKSQKKSPLRRRPQLSWKFDPTASFSDWRVEIYHEESGDVDVYNLHRNFVGFGPRKSAFFAKKFAREMAVGGSASDARLTRLALPKRQAQTFPIALDFMYHAGEAQQKFTPERACTVFELSQYLEIQGLQNAIAEFYRKNITLNNMGKFLKCATKLKTDRLVLVCKRRIGSIIRENPEQAVLLRPKFLTELMRVSRTELEGLRYKDTHQRPRGLEISRSRHWSIAAYYCISHHKSGMTQHLFNLLSNEESLPAIDASVALQWLGVDSIFVAVSSEYTSLQRRCAKAIADDWIGFSKGFASPRAASKVLQELPSCMLADILVNSVCPPPQG
jgi:hypothetical protein